MKTHNQKPYTLDGTMRFWTGMVESRDDPFQLGRVQVRIIGFHTEDKTLIPTETLPWASPLNPINSASVSGVGTSPTGMMIGSMVMGFWADFPDCQNPIVLGTLNLQEGYGGGLFNPYNNSIGDFSPIGPGTMNPTGDGPLWLRIARNELQKGVKEIPGTRHNPEVLKYGRDLGFTTDDKQHPWCAAFTRWCLKEANVDVTGLTGGSKSVANSPAFEQITEPLYGCIAVKNRSGTANGAVYGHTGFWVGRKSGSDLYLGGNQSNKVSIAPQSIRHHFGYYWPKGEDKSAYGNPSFGSGVKGLLNLIGRLEAPKGYNQVYGGSKVQPPRPITTMTVAEVRAWQDRSVAAGSFSSAAGRFQFIRDTLDDIVASGTISRNDLFNEETQDKAAGFLLNRRGLGTFINDRDEIAFGNRLAREWASLPVVSGPKYGRSFYSKDGVNKSLIDPETVLAQIRQI